MSIEEEEFALGNEYSADLPEVIETPHGRAHLDGLEYHVFLSGPLEGAELCNTMDAIERGIEAENQGARCRVFPNGVARSYEVTYARFTFVVEDETW